MADQDSRDLMYLASKRTALNAPGVKLSNNYYSLMNASVETVETTYNTGRLTISLTTKDFGGQAQVVIPNSSFLGEVYLHLELPNLGFASRGSGYNAGATLSRGWGYACISSINFLFGSSNVSQISMNGQSLLQTVMMSADTAEKRSELFRLGGQEMLQPITWVDPVDGLTKPNPNVVLSADILLPFPWSSSSGLHSKLPFDTNVLSNPITIQIQFNPRTTIYGGLNQNAWANSFLAATAIFRQGDLTNKDQSLRRTLENNKDLSMFYPFIHKQSYTPTQFLGSTDQNSPVSVPLLGFINADLVGIMIGVVRVGLLTGSANGSPNIFQYDQLSNVNLQFNGLSMMNSPGQAWKLYQCAAGSLGASYFQNSLIKPHGADPPFDSVPQDTYIMVIDFSRIRSTTFEGQFQNVWRIANNTLTLSFNTESGPDTQYQLYATYMYNGMAQINAGQTSIYFD